VVLTTSRVCKVHTRGRGVKDEVSGEQAIKMEGANWDEI
jgi:hypothetical protein